MKFRRHNVALIEDLVGAPTSMDQRTVRARAARDPLERQFEKDREALEKESGRGWSKEADDADA